MVVVVWHKRIVETVKAKMKRNLRVRKDLQFCRSLIIVKTYMISKGGNGVVVGNMRSLSFQVLQLRISIYARSYDLLFEL